MLIAKVIGTTVSTVKDEKLTGRKLLILRQTDEAGSPAGKPYVAVDTMAATAVWLWWRWTRWMRASATLC